MKKLLDFKSFFVALTIVLLTVVLIFIGSRRLQNFDAALIAYLFGTLFAIFGIVYRYMVWIQKPPTRVYLLSSINILFSKHFLKYFSAIIIDFIKNIFLQKFIFKRSKKTGIAHLLMAIGCTMSFAITIPLTFGWINFDLEYNSGLNPDATKMYIAYFFGFPMLKFSVDSLIGFFIFSALNWFAIMVIIGASYFLMKRMTNIKNISTQTFEGDIVPLLLLILISISGIALSIDYTFLKGISYQFMAVIHAFFVIIFLIWIPFGKFFHIIQRPAQLGVHIYKEVGRMKGMKKCNFTKKEYTSQTHISDLKKITKELGFKLENKDGVSILDYSPEGKRDLLAIAHLKERQKSGKYFG